VPLSPISIICLPVTGPWCRTAGSGKVTVGHRCTSHALHTSVVRVQGWKKEGEHATYTAVYTLLIEYYTLDRYMPPVSTSVCKTGWTNLTDSNPDVVSFSPCRSDNHSLSAKSDDDAIEFDIFQVFYGGLQIHSVVAICICMNEIWRRTCETVHETWSNTFRMSYFLTVDRFIDCMCNVAVSSNQLVWSLHFPATSSASQVIRHHARPNAAILSSI